MPQNHAPIFDAEIIDPQPSSFSPPPRPPSSTRPAAATANPAATSAPADIERYHSRPNFFLQYGPLCLVAAMLIGWVGLRAYVQGKTEAAYNEGLAAGRTAGLAEGRTQTTAELQPQLDQANQQTAAAAAQTAQAIAQKAQCDASIAQIKSVLGVK